MKVPGPELVARFTTLATRVLAPNPGPMTLDGTNTYVVRDPGSLEAIIVDPGPLDPGHLEILQEFGPIALILITHHHHDHTDAARTLAAVTSAPIRAASPEWCVGGDPLVAGEIVHAAGVRIEVIATPGHTSDSVCFALLDDSTLEGVARGSILTGDTILGRGSTVIAHPGGELAEYLDSLRLLSARKMHMLPGHGGMSDDIAAMSEAQLAHRTERLRHLQIEVGTDAADPDDAVLVERLVESVYADVPAELRSAARASVRAQLRYLSRSQLS